MAFELELQTGSYGWPAIVDKTRGITVMYRGPQPKDVPNVYLHMPDGEAEAAVFDETKLTGQPELDVVWIVQSVRAEGLSHRRREMIQAVLKEALEALSFRKQAIKIKDIPVVKSITVDFDHTDWG